MVSAMQRQRSGEAVHPEATPSRGEGSLRNSTEPVHSFHRVSILYISDLWGFPA